MAHVLVFAGGIGGGINRGIRGGITAGSQRCKHECGKQSRCDVFHEILLCLSCFFNGNKPVFLLLLYYISHVMSICYRKIPIDFPSDTVGN